MSINKFNIVAYIKPTGDFELFSKCLANIQKTKHLDKFCISFVEKLPDNFIKELNKYKNIIWKEEVDKYWAQEIRDLIEQHPSDYYFMWEEDSNIFDIDQFEKSFKILSTREVDFLLTQDLKWIERAKHLLNNNLAIEEDDFLYFNWGTHYAKYCRESSYDKLINGAYPVTVNGIFSKNLIVNLLDNLLNSTYWKEITSGNFDHFHKNPKLPHSFEVYPGFWWEGGPNNGCGEVEYTTMISKTQFAEELGDRLIDKINKQKQQRPTVNIVGYDDWYTEDPWNRHGANQQFNVTYNEPNANITYFIKDGIYKAKDKNFNTKTKIALLTECRLMDPHRYNFIEENHELFDHIVTYDDQLFEKFSDKTIVTPYGGTWIKPSLQKIYPKTKLCSYISSFKNHTSIQERRIELMQYFYKNKHIDIELFGRDHNPLPEEHHPGGLEGKILALKDYAFSISIENHIQNNYFSEKLMDCFLTGTIPLYYGCTEIKKYFNVKGMIILDDVKDAKDIVPTLSYDLYKSKIDIIEENFNLAKQYIDSVSYSYKKI
tara:strand:+ start:417 stop:2048 length:1632 start_codon:yes stop_codon:yes gene_type:complete